MRYGIAKTGTTTVGENRGKRFVGKGRLNVFQVDGRDVRLLAFALQFSNYGSRGRSTQSGGIRTGTYVVCLECGKELPYDWKEMRVVSERESKSARALVTKEAA